MMIRPMTAEDMDAVLIVEMPVLQIRGAGKVLRIL